MPLDILTLGEALVEVMRTGVDQPLSQPGPFVGPYPSGAPFIFAVQAARLGMKAGAIGSVGADAFGACLLDQLRADGVETAGVRQHNDAPTGLAFVAYRADGVRDFVFSLGAGGRITGDMLLPELFAGLRCFHVMGSTLSMSGDVLRVCQEALRMALEADALISFDPNLRPELLGLDEARAAFAEFMAAADVLMPTAEELLRLTGSGSIEDAVDKLLAERPKRTIVVTRGAAGCTVYDASGAVDLPGFAVTEIDPTGAGDCFDAGFLSAWLAGESAVDAARFGNACGALAVMAKGPMAGAKGREDVTRFMESGV